MKKYNLYENKLDKAWFDSSNILYAECDDIENSLKTVRIYFKTGRVYQYYNVNVNDYIMFRDDSSQGKAFNKFIKKYESERLDDIDISVLEDNLNIAIESEIKIKDIDIKINDNCALEINKCGKARELIINESSKEDIINLLKIIGIKII